MLNDFLLAKLNSLTEENRLRQLPPTAKGIDFSSNDYLGLAHSDDLFRRIESKARSFIGSGNLNGASGSRLLSGNSSFTQETEHKLSEIFLAPSALIFNSGYTANLAVMSSIPQRGDTIIYDELAHTCIKDGARLSLANRYTFRHNDLDDLQKKLSKAQGRIFIAIESIYSMDGDQCPLAEVVALAQKYSATIILDEAHSTGVTGAGGSGLATSLQLHDQIDIRIYTFGKAMGIHGACVVGSSELIHYLVNFARPFIYTTAMPPHSIAAIACAFDFLQENIHRQETLCQKISLFTKATYELKNSIVSTSAIQTALFPGNENVRKAAAFLQERNFDIRPILSPTVPAGKERLRICLHSYNEDRDILSLAAHLNELNDAKHSTIAY